MPQRTRKLRQRKRTEYGHRHRRYLEVGVSPWRDRDGQHWRSNGLFESLDDVKQAWLAMRETILAEWVPTRSHKLPHFLERHSDLLD